MNSVELLDALKSKYELTYDKGVADMLHLSTTFISKIRHGEKIFGSDTLLVIAKLLDIELEKIACFAMAERAKEKNSRTKWLKSSK